TRCVSSRCARSRRSKKGRRPESLARRLLRRVTVSDSRDERIAEEKGIELWAVGFRAGFWQHHWCRRLVPSESASGTSRRFAGHPIGISIAVDRYEVFGRANDR